MAGFDSNPTGFDTPTSPQAILAIIADPVRAKKALDDITAAKAELKTASDTLDVKRQAIEVIHAAADAARADIARVQGDLAKRVKTYDAASAALDVRQQKLDAQASVQTLLRNEQDAREKGLAAHETAAAAKVSELADREAKVVAREAALTARMERLSAAISGA